MGASIDPFGATHGDQLTSQTLLIRHVVWRPSTQPASVSDRERQSSLMKMMHGERRFARLFQRPEKLFGLFDQKCFNSLTLDKFCLDLNIIFI